MKLVRADFVRYNQSSQTLPIKFSWVNKDEDQFTQLYYGAMCKEYITDVMYWHKFNKEGRAYGLVHPKDFREDPYMLVEFPDPVNKEYFFSNLHLFKEIAWDAEVVYEDVSEVILKLDPEWLKASWRISLWSILVKSFSHEGGKTVNDVWKLPHTEQSHASAIRYHDPSILNRLLNKLRSIEVDAWAYLDERTKHWRGEDIHAILGFFNTFGVSHGLKPVYKDRLGGPDAL